MAERVVSMLLPPKIDPAETRRLGSAVRERVKVTPARLAGIRNRSSIYGVSAVDDRGRIMAHHLVTELDWQPGTRHSLAECSGLLVVSADERGQCQLNSSGHLRLPATLRHWYGIGAGTRVLLVADPNEGRLIIHPPASLDTMITRWYAEVFAGDAA